MTVAVGQKPARPVWVWALVLFVVLRVCVSLIAASFYPPEGESFLPDDAPLAWFTQPWAQWDVEYYESIAADGYGARPEATSFHPLYPLIARVFGWMFGGNWVFGLLITSGLATIGVFWLLERLIRLDVPWPQSAWSWLGLLALPSAYILFAPYPEALFLFAAVACFWFARQQRWWFAGLCGAVVALTRQQGLLLVLPLLWEMADQLGGWRVLLQRWQVWLAALVPILGYALVIIFRAQALGGLPEGWWLPQNIIWSLLISPETTDVVEDQQFLMPWTALWLAVEQWMSGEEPFGPVTTLMRGFDLFTGLVYLMLFGLFWRYLRPSYRVYCGLIFLISFMYHTGFPFAYIALSRHLFLAFPLAIGAARWATTPLRQMSLLLLGFLFVIAQVIFFVSHVWVP